MLPIGEGAKFTGVVNVLENKAYTPARARTSRRSPFPPIWPTPIETRLEEITEAAADADDELTGEVL